MTVPGSRTLMNCCVPSGPARQWGSERVLPLHPVVEEDLTNE
jgi:hypothetical protein